MSDGILKKGYVYIDPVTKQKINYDNAYIFDVDPGQMNKVNLVPIKDMKKRIVPTKKKATKKEEAEKKAIVKEEAAQKKAAKKEAAKKKAAKKKK